MTGRRHRRPAKAACRDWTISTPMTIGLAASRRAALRRSAPVSPAVGTRRLCRRCGLLGLDLVGRLVLPQPFEGRLSHHAVPVQPANSISATSSGFSQWTFDPSCGAPMPVNGDLARLGCLQLAAASLDLRLAIAGPDTADIDEMVAAVHAHEQRAELAVRRRPATDDDLMPSSAF